MEFLAGFVIALAIAMTGVGGGTVTTPVLMLFFHMPPSQSVGTALAFTAAVKFLVAPAYVLRHAVNYRVFLWMLAGGLPGVVIGALVLTHMDTKTHTHLLYVLLGSIILVSASINLWHLRRKPEIRAHLDPHGDRRRLLPWLMLPIGAEVGFSSAGAGALGTLAVFATTQLETATVVGTDVLFGFVISVVGSGLHLGSGNYDRVVLEKLVAGGVFGVMVGIYLVKLVPSRALRAGVSVWLASLGAQLCWTGLR